MVSLLIKSFILLGLLATWSLCEGEDDDIEHIKLKQGNVELSRQSDLPAYCQVSSTDSTLSCDGGKIQCGTIRNFTGEGTQNYRDFAIGYVPHQEKVELAELVKFYLYPKIENDYYQNYTIQIGFKFHRFSIYYSQGMFDDGFRIGNLTCYTELVNYFRNLNVDQYVKVKADEDSTENVSIFGYLNIV